MNEYNEKNYYTLNEMLRVSSFSLVQTGTHIPCWYCLGFECGVNMFLLFFPRLGNHQTASIQQCLYPCDYTQVEWNKTRLCHKISLESTCLKGLSYLQYHSRQEEMWKMLMPRRGPRNAYNGGTLFSPYKPLARSA